jgi:hypothetical protein
LEHSQRILSWLARHRRPVLVAAFSVLLLGYVATQARLLEDARTHAGEIAGYRSLWMQKRPRHYEYVVEFGGSSVLGFYGPLRVEVEDAKTVKVSGMRGLNPPDASAFSEVDTIEGLIDFIATTLRRRNQNVKLKFDRQYGYPLLASMSENMPEGDTEVKVLSFRVLP